MINSSQGGVWTLFGSRGNNVVARWPVWWERGYGNLLQVEIDRPGGVWVCVSLRVSNGGGIVGSAGGVPEEVKDLEVAIRGIND